MNGNAAVQSASKSNKALATITVQTGIEAKHLEKIKEYGLQIVSKTGELAGLYLTLCTYIRQNKVDSKLVSYELSQVGFRKQRITEINRVATSPNDVWQQYEARALGFDKTLALARVSPPGEHPVLTPAGQQLLADGAVTKRDANAALLEVKRKTNGNGHKKQSSRKTAQRDAARRIGWANNIMDTLMPEMKFPLVFKRGDYVVTVTYEPKIPGKAPPK